MTDVTEGQALQEGKLALLTPLQMGDADRAAKVSGSDGFGLMEAAGSAVAIAVGVRWLMRPVLVRDGFVLRYHTTTGTDCRPARARFWLAASGSSTIMCCKEELMKRETFSSNYCRCATMLAFWQKNTIQFRSVS